MCTDLSSYLSIAGSLPTVEGAVFIDQIKNSKWVTKYYYKTEVIQWITPTNCSGHLLSNSFKICICVCTLFFITFITSVTNINYAASSKKEHVKYVILKTYLLSQW